MPIAFYYLVNKFYEIRLSTEKKKLLTLYGVT